MVIIVNDHAVVLGRLDAAALDGQPDVAASQVMAEGPTARANRSTRSSMAKANVDQIIVTYPDGCLDGIFHR